MVVRQLHPEIEAINEFMRTENRSLETVILVLYDSSTFGVFQRIFQETFQDDAH